MLDIQPGKVLEVVIEVEEKIGYIFAPEEISQTVNHTIRKCEFNGKDTAYFYILLENELRDYLMRTYINLMGEGSGRKIAAVSCPVQ